MLSIIVATDLSGCIGIENKLPWHLPADLAYFKKATTGHTVVMGRKTFDSIGRPLPNRKNVVLTRDQEWIKDGVEVVHSVEELIKSFSLNEEEVFIIGGSQLYKACLPHAKRIYRTLIHGNFNGDAYFPVVDESEWKLISNQKGNVDKKNLYEHEFMIFEKI